MLRNSRFNTFFVFLTMLGLPRLVYASDSIPNIPNPKSKNIIQRLFSYFEDTNKGKKDKSFDFSIIGGPHYNSDVKLGLGLVASGLYHLDTCSSVSPSNVSLYGDFTTTGFYVIGIEGNTIFPKERYRIDASCYFSSFPDKYWGIGYEKGSSGNSTDYTREDIQSKLDFLKRIFPNTYSGITLAVADVNARKIDDPNFLNGQNSRITSWGAGVIFSYDSRDFIPNPSRGLCLRLEHIFYMYKGNNFQRTNISANLYKQIWRGGILAGDLHTLFNSNNAPWTMTGQLGGSRRMRGYHRGQFNDLKLITTQLELRQKIYGRSGMVAWIGAGNIFPTFNNFKWRQTLPTYGLGYRWEFKKRVNIRLDYGIGRGQTGFYFNINEAF